MLTIEEVQKTLSDSMLSMQKSMEDERKGFKEKIKKLEDTLSEKEEEITDLKNQLLDTKVKNVDKNIMEKLREDKDLLEKELETKVNDYKNLLINLSTLNNQIELQKQKILQIQMDKKKLEEKIEEQNNSFIALQGEVFNKTKTINELNNIIDKKKQDLLDKDEIIKKKDLEYNQLKEELNQKVDDYNGLLNYIKEIKQHEEQLKKEREDVKIEMEKYNSLNKELIKQKEEMKKVEIEKLLKQKEKETEEEKDNKQSEDKEKEKKEEEENINFVGQEKMITDLLCEYLLKLNNLQYFISLFDLLDRSLMHYDELNYISGLNNPNHESMNDILYNFYESLKSYFILQGKNSSLNDFLLQKTFRLTDLRKEDIEIIKRIHSLKINKNINILDVYRKKRELFFKSKEFTFNILKEKILGTSKKDLNIHCEFLKITKPPLELEINFDKIINQNRMLLKYQVNNIFIKLRELTLHLSNVPIFLLYSLLINCNNLNTIKIIFLKSETSQNKANVNSLNDYCPILINYLKKLNSFSLINLPLLSNKLTSLMESLKLSKIKKLELNNCIQKKEDINLIIPYFSQNALTEINISNHNLHIPSALNNTLLNYNINTQLTSIIFNNCKLNEDDIKAISNYIVSSSSILLCDIGKNILSQLSCSTFGYSILKTTSLETLRINECAINGESLLFIFNGKGSKPLKHVNLNGNKFGDIGLVSISSFLKNSPLLESIELENCGGTDMGFISLTSMIQGNTNSKIKYVNFHKNNITKQSLNLLKKFNDIFTSRKVLFALDKIETQGIDIDCAIFN